MDETELRSLIGFGVVDRDGKSVGNVEYIFNDDSTGQPEWIGVIIGSFKQQHVLVPVSGAEKDGVYLRVPWPKDRVKGAPTYGKEDRGGALGLGGYRIAISKEKEQATYRYYGIEDLNGAGP
jgi:sporulation protein YlmC with PRC-barrel domain